MLSKLRKSPPLRSAWETAFVKKVLRLCEEPGFLVLPLAVDIVVLSLCRIVGVLLNYLPFSRIVVRIGIRTKMPISIGSRRRKDGPKISQMIPPMMGAGMETKA